MATTVSGKIIRKWVKPGTRGNTIGFIVIDKGQEKMVSVFESKLTPEAKAVLMALVEGMYADFETIENVSKTDGKTYLNITSATPITQLREDTPASCQPAEPAATPKEGDTRVRSMVMSYGSVWIIEQNKLRAAMDPVDLLGYDDAVRVAKRYEQYILTGE